jgi:hypothetical protein
MPSTISAGTTAGTAIAVAGDTTGNLAFQTNGTTTAMTITTAQRVGIGTTGPDTQFEVRDTTNNTQARVTSNFEAALWLVNGGGSEVSVVNAGGSNVMSLRTNNTERARFTSSGDFYVGTTTGTIGTSNKGFSINGGDGEVRFSRLVGASSPVMNAYGSQGEARILGDGDLENTNNRYTGISDIKFKQNIVDAKSQWADIKAIQVRNYELTAYPDRKQIGVVAQELEQVCPKLVIEREDANGETYKSVAYSVLYMKAVKALQEAMERIEAIEAKVDAQAAEIAALKGA